jgi:molecular chaperone GrpE
MEDLPGAKEVEETPGPDAAAARTAEEDQVRQECNELHDRYVRVVADFDNFRKAMEREKERVHALAAERLVTDFLGILDDFESALRELPPSRERDGLEMLRKKVFHVLEQQGLRRVDALGRKFDPYYHEALCGEESDQEEGTILEEYQSGYMVRTKVIRASKVKIAKKKQDFTGE